MLVVVALTSQNIHFFLVASHIAHAGVSGGHQTTPKKPLI
jgi:hypothetical protein